MEIFIEHDIVEACGRSYVIIKLLGKGKGGYSYLAEDEKKEVVLKQIHHEPCDYYSFGNKIEAEARDYERLMKAGIRIPELLAIDFEKERIVKQYIPGRNVFELVREGLDVDPYRKQVSEMASLAKENGLNIDYFPTNFIVHEDLIWYVDYECNEYSREWDFENWGSRYWSMSEEFMKYLKKQERNEE